MDNAEERVSKFYNTKGWEVDGGITEDAKRFEDLRECADEYVRKCRLRVLPHIPNEGVNILDMASGPIQYEEYLEFSKHFEKRYCVDLSSDALEQAKKKIGDHGVFLHGSFFDISIEENFFDCSLSIHTIYHMDKDKQEEAVRKLIYITKPGKPIIIVYSNPYTLVGIPYRVLRKFKHALKKLLKTESESPVLYFHPHPINWWNRFTDTASLKILPWRSFSSDIQKSLIPDNSFGKNIFRKLFKLENKFPNFFVKHFQYPMIILVKKPV